MSEIRTAHLMTLALEVEEPQVISGTPVGTRRIAYVSGGSFDGARLSGIVLPGGGDWILERTDGAYLLDVRITLLTEDREMIYMTYRGIRHASDDVMARLNSGDAVAEEEYYLRASAFFETGADKYNWLNRIVSVASGYRPPEGPVYEVFGVV